MAEQKTQPELSGAWQRFKKAMLVLLKKILRFLLIWLFKEKKGQGFYDQFASFIRLFRSLIVRDLLKNKLRTSLTVFGIALGVAILLAINLANLTAVDHFKQSIDRIGGKTNLEITASGSSNATGWVPESILANFGWLTKAGVKLTPVIEQSAIFKAPTADRFVVRVLGLDMLADQAFRSYDWQLDENSAHSKNRPETFFNIFESDGAFIGPQLARYYHLNIGRTFSLLINDQEKRFQVAGILSDKGLGGAYGGDLIVMDIATAQQAFSMTARDQWGDGRLSRIDAIIPDSLKSKGTIEDPFVHITSQLEASLPVGFEVSRPERRSGQVDKMLRAYRYNLTVLSFIALLAGMFLIYNTMSITVIRRRTEIGTLRALGVSRKMVGLLFGTEALFLGVLGSILGIGLGLLFELGAVKAVSSTVQNLYMGIGVNGFSYSPLELVKSFGFGLLTTLLGALVPIIEAASVSPAESIRRASYESKIRQGHKKLMWVGLGLAVIAAWSWQQPPIDRLPLFGFISAFCILLSAAFLMPTFLNWLLQRIEPLAFRYGKQEGKLAIKQLRGSLGRTSVAVASLMVGIAMMVSLGIMIGSFRETVKTWVQQTLKADLWIEPVAKGSGQFNAKLSPQVVDAIRYAPEVEAVDAFYELPIQFKNSKGSVEPARIGVGQWHIAKDYGGELRFLDGRSSREVLGSVLDHLMSDPSVIVTESFANRNNIRTGQMITLDTHAGPMDLRVAGIYTDYSSDLGYIAMPRELYNLYYEDDSTSGMAVYLDKDASADEVKGRLQRKFGGRYLLNIRSNKELKEEVLRIFDNTFAITYALHIVAILVALLGVMNSLLAMVLAARRDFGILKYLGASTAQIKKTILIQAGIFGLLGNLSGFGVGLILSFLLVFVINKQSFGWTIQWHIPFAFLIQSFLLVMITAVFSGLIPARLAAKTPAPEVLHEE